MAVQEVWLPFLLAVVIIGLLIWRFMSYVYQTRLENADSTKELLERQLTEYREKLSGATPDEAKARMDALEARVDALSPRTINPTQRQRLVPFLERFSGSSVEILADVAAADAVLLSREFKSVFHRADWQVSAPQLMGVTNPPDSGIGLRVADMSSLTDQEKSVADALSEAGIEFDLQTRKNGRRGHDIDVSLLLTHQLQSRV